MPRPTTRSSAYAAGYRRAVKDAAALLDQRAAAIDADPPMPDELVFAWRSQLDGKTFNNGRATEARDCARALKSLKPTK